MRKCLEVEGKVDSYYIHIDVHELIDRLLLFKGGRPENTYALGVGGWVKPKAYSLVQEG